MLWFWSNISVFNPPIWPQPLTRCFWSLVLLSPIPLPWCMSKKVACRRHVKFELFIKIWIFGQLEPPTGPTPGGIGPVFELSRRLTHILPPVKNQINCINIFWVIPLTRKSLRRRRRLKNKTIVSPENIFGGYNDLIFIKKKFENLKNKNSV